MTKPTEDGQVSQRWRAPAMPKTLRINFVGSFTTGYVGETSDETHLAQELEDLGHEVRRCPRDIWKAYCDGDKPNADWVLPKQADINIICKWHHFDDPRYIEVLRADAESPVLYWTWDFMQWPTAPEFHRYMAVTADLHLTNELGHFEFMTKFGIKPYYFTMDVVSDEYAVYLTSDEPYDVTFFGSCIDQGVRKEYLKKIGDKFQLNIFAWNPKDWQDYGLSANPAVYGNSFNKLVSQSKVCLQFSTTDDIYGYWSNRVGKVLRAGGLLLARFVPGMEMSIGDAADYFTSVDEAIEKIDYYLTHDQERSAMKRRARLAGETFTSKHRMKQLSILMERYLKGGI